MEKSFFFNGRFGFFVLWHSNFRGAAGYLMPNPPYRGKLVVIFNP